MYKNNLTLISHPLCPFVQRAAIVLLEKRIPFERINIDLSAKPDWFLEMSPTGKVPALKVHQEDGKDAILFESMVICEYINETQGGASMYPKDALLRARHRAWIEFSTQALAEAWQFLNATDQGVADAKRQSFQGHLKKIEDQLGLGPYFAGPDFGMVDAVYAPIFRYFKLIDTKVFLQIFKDLPRVSSWISALEIRESVKSAVAADYAERFQLHLRQQSAMLAI